jgi:hypothetical protein
MAVAQHESRFNETDSPLPEATRFWRAIPGCGKSAKRNVDRMAQTG